MTGKHLPQGAVAQCLDVGAQTGAAGLGSAHAPSRPPGMPGGTGKRITEHERDERHFPGIELPDELRSG